MFLYLKGDLVALVALGVVGSPLQEDQDEADGVNDKEDEQTY